MPPRIRHHLLLLPNLGNTCYANAVFQLLAASPSFTENLAKEAEAAAVAKGEVGREDARAAELLAATRDMLVLGRSEEVKRVLKAFHVMASRGGFRIHDSNDAQEFLVLLLECLRRASVRGYRLLGDRVHNKHEDPALCRMLDDNWNKEIGASFFAPLACVQGQYVSETRCGACGYTTHAPQVHTVLPIPPRPTIEAGVREFFAAERVEGWKCDRCGERHPETCKVLRTWRSSRVVVLNVTRFLPDGRKDSSAVAAPEFLDLTPFHASGAVRRPARVGYELRAVLNHAGGSRSGGHYTCDVRRRRRTTEETTTSWDRLDDDVEMLGDGVRPREGNTMSYMLLYEARQ